MEGENKVGLVRGISIVEIVFQFIFKLFCAIVSYGVVIYFGKSLTILQMFAFYIAWCVFWRSSFVVHQLK